MLLGIELRAFALNYIQANFLFLRQNRGNLPTLGLDVHFSWHSRLVGAATADSPTAYKDVMFIGLRSHPVSSFSFNYLLKGPVSDTGQSH